jgi:hypothetical protein
MAKKSRTRRTDLPQDRFEAGLMENLLRRCYRHNGWADTGLLLDELADTGDVLLMHGQQTGEQWGCAWTPRGEGVEPLRVVDDSPHRAVRKWLARC